MLLKLFITFAFMFFLQAANAIPINVNGNLNNQFDHGLVEFNVSAASTVNFWTDSFNPNFDTLIGLYDSVGNQIAWNDDHGSNFGGANPGLNHVGQDSWDSSLTLLNLVGNYTLAITAFNSNNWYDFEERKSLANMFTSNAKVPLGRGVGSYYNINIAGDNVALGHQSDSLTTVPEPGIIWLMVIGLIGFSISMRSWPLKKVAI